MSIHSSLSQQLLFYGSGGDASQISQVFSLVLKPKLPAHPLDVEFYTIIPILQHQ
jgi:hypothetical protein